VARSPVRIRPIRSAIESFYFQASNGSVALPVAGYNYNSDWTPLLAGLSPAGMAASLAAPEPYVRLSRIWLPPRVCDGASCPRPSLHQLRCVRPSTASATLFAGFTATMAESDFSCPCIIGYGSSPSRCGPSLSRNSHGQTRYLPASDAIPLHVMWPRDPGRATAPRITVPHMLP